MKEKSLEEQFADLIKKIDDRIAELEALEKKKKKIIKINKKMMSINIYIHHFY